MKYFCIISHTHWDREWYASLEIFRLKLVDLMDRCLETLRKYPEFIFHLDAQTVVLEDYLEFRPSKRDVLRRLISQGRLIVGPWYLQNDFYLTSGEATIRNLIEGTRLAGEFGACSKVGYAADQFGNISQLPQILAGFGIDNFIFGRGLGDFEKQPDGSWKRLPHASEFLWEGADGTEALAIHMKYWYNNAQRFSADREKAMLLLKSIEESFEGVALTPYLLLMNGVDHLEAQDDLLPILEDLRTRIDSDHRVRQYRMEEYVREVQRYLKEKNVPLERQKGELRTGGDWEILKGTLSSRIYLKKANVEAQNLLENRLEPLYAMLEASGAKGSYSLETFRWMWKALLKNHPHDSICGCSCDAVHAHMEDNFWRLRDISEDMLRRGLLLMADHTDLPGRSDSAYQLLAVNTTETALSGCQEITLDFPVSENTVGFTVTSPDGKPAAFELLSHEKAVKDIFSPINLPGSIDIDRFVIRLDTGLVPPYSAKAFLVTPDSTPLSVSAAPEQPAGEIRLDDGRFCLTVTPDGRASLLDRETGRELPDFLDAEDTADRGDSYVYGLAEEAPVYASSFPASVSLLSDTPLCKSVVIRRTLMLPAAYDFDKMARTVETVPCELAVTLTLRKGQPYVEMSYTFDNRACDHRSRLLVKTGIEADCSKADIPFDIICRPDNETRYPSMSYTHPNTSFAAVEGKDGGAAVLTEGQHDYEHLPDLGALAVTIVRATGAINRTPEFQQTGGDTWNVPGNQCLRLLSGRMGVSTFAGDVEKAALPLLAKAFRNPPLGFFAPCDAKKFAGGRPAVQDTRLKEFFYLPDPYPKAVVPNCRPVFEVKGEGVCVSALKEAENGSGLILRLWNYTDRPAEAEVAAKGLIRCCNLAEQIRGELGTDTVQLTLKPKEILTLHIS